MMSGSPADTVSSKLDWVMAGLTAALVGGFYIDLWAHSHGRVDDTFFTPWHGILYAAAFAIGAVLFVIAIRVRAQGIPWRQVLPRGYTPHIAWPTEAPHSRT